jgi:cholesterol transport system auxiliary component
MGRQRLIRSGWSAGIVALALGGCALFQTRGDPPRLYALEAAPSATAAGTGAGGPTLLVSEPRARAGFDTPAMIYVRRTHELESFAKSRWVDSPARMLAPLLVHALEGGGRFQAVVLAPGGVAASVRLDTEIESLVQEFTVRPSRVRFALRARLVDLAARRVLATRAFEAVEEAPSDDPYGGVVAANRAAARVLGELSAWCGAEARPAGRE